MSPLNPTATEAQRMGVRGEELAARYLVNEGFDLLHRNWRHGRYELDLVAERDGVLHIVEVKTRRSGSLTPPEEALTEAKFESLQRAAQHYIHTYGFDGELQFDLIAVEIDPSGAHRLRYLPDAVSGRW